ncbi:MAG: hypothetical protein MK066_04250 [Crocinitomicaceae bacterium]|nr:hypothetical protein [Crocinitomicaceae bacterium]
MKTITLISIFIALLLSSCSRDKDKNTLVGMPSIVGEVYFFTQNFDSIHCSVFSACDCCSGHMIFLEDDDFMYVDYCVGDISYHTGKYRFEKDSLFIK